MKKIAGNWYDSNGNLVLKIDSNDYTINGCKVLSINYDFTMPQNNPTYFVSYPLVYKIYENNGYREIYFEYRGKVTSDDYYEMLIMDSKIVLRRTKNPQHFESVGGIHLGMSQNQVLALYGQPSKKDKRDAISDLWKYENEGFDLEFVTDIVTKITIYKNGSRKFDWSGLSANDSMNTFVKKYRATAGYVSGCIRIGHCEAIRFNEDSVTLSIDTPS